MAIKESPLSEDEKESFKNRSKEVSGSIKEGIKKWAGKEIVTDRNLLQRMNVDTVDTDDEDEDEPAAKPKSKKPQSRSTREVVEEDEDTDEEDEDADDEDQDEDEDSDDDSDEESDEDSDDEDAEEDEDGEADDEEGEEDEEDLDPKAKDKQQKRIDRLTADKKALERELDSMKKSVAEKEEDEPDDPNWKELTRIFEKHGEAGIEQLQDEIAVGLRKAKTDEDALKLQKLNRLSSKFLREAPERFTRKQVREFQKAVIDTQKDMDRKAKGTFAKAAREIFALADSIYKRSNSLKKSVDGQAEAWRLATEHFEELSKKSNPADKEEKLRLKRQNNKFKKKMSLDGKTNRNEQKPKKDVGKMRERARTGGTEDKVAYVKEAFDIDSLIPEDLRDI